MTYEVLARKWRPQIFEDVIGQGHITRTLVNAIKNDRLAHAYLFSGARGVGKTSIARILAKAINCENGEPGIPCNQCRSCEEITTGASVDVQEIDGASNRGIDEIRELRDNIKYMPSSGRFRIYIIDEVHMLTKEAFNALLKTLEEPPSHVKFFFATTEPQKVPVTILSRCQRFDFKRIPLVKIVEQLERIAAEEGIEIRKTALSLIAREAEGSMRDAESLLDQVVSFTGQRVEDKDIIDILGIIDRDLLFEASQAVIEGNAEKCIQIVDRIYHYGYDLKQFYRAFMDQTRNLLVTLIAPATELIDMTESDMKEIRRQAEAAGKERLHQSLQMLIDREDELRYTSHPRLVLETIMIRLCRIVDVLSFDELIRKIETLEKRLSSTLPSDGESAPGRLSDPGISWGSEGGDEAGQRGPGEDRQDPDWDGFLEYLASKNRAMSKVLKGWRFLNLDGDTLEIARGGNAFSADYLDDPQRAEKLKGYCRTFFKREMDIRVIKESMSGFPKPATEDKKNGPRCMKGEDELSPPVKDILNVFQGEVKGVVSGKQNGSINGEEPETSRR
jgi:DNA polymerase-3 subunit gamma/tau